MSKPKASRTKAKKAPKLRVAQSGEASVVVQDIKDARAHVKGFTVVADGTLRGLMGKYTIGSAFLERACDAVESSDRLRAACDFDPDVAREVIAFDAAFAAPQAEAETLAAGIAGARIVRYIEQIDLAEQVLKVADGIAASPDQKDLKKHVKDMRAARRVKRKIKAKPVKAKKGRGKGTSRGKGKGKGTAAAAGESPSTPTAKAQTEKTTERTMEKVTEKG